MHEVAREALISCSKGEEESCRKHNESISKELEYLKQHWNQFFPNESPPTKSIERHLKFGETKDYEDIMYEDFHEIDKKAEQKLSEYTKENSP
jgi:hypothetical protein